MDESSLLTDLIDLGLLSNGYTAGYISHSSLQDKLVVRIPSRDQTSGANAFVVLCDQSSYASPSYFSLAPGLRSDHWQRLLYQAIHE
jgi:hypothetical protein